MKTATTSARLPIFIFFFIRCWCVHTKLLVSLQRTSWKAAGKQHFFEPFMAIYGVPALHMCLYRVTIVGISIGAGVDAVHGEGECGWMGLKLKSNLQWNF
jgi:hypothetical protein